MVMHGAQEFLRSALTGVLSYAKETYSAKLGAGQGETETALGETGERSERPVDCDGRIWKLGIIEVWVKGGLCYAKKAARRSWERGRLRRWKL